MPINLGNLLDVAGRFGTAATKINVARGYARIEGDENAAKLAAAKREEERKAAAEEREREEDAARLQYLHAQRRVLEKQINTPAETPTLKGTGGREFPDTPEGQAAFDTWERQHNPARYRETRSSEGSSTGGITTGQARDRTYWRSVAEDLVTAAGGDVNRALAMAHENPEYKAARVAGQLSNEMFRAPAARLRMRPQAQDDPQRDAVRKATGRTPVNAMEREIENALVEGKTTTEIIAEIEADPDMSPEEKRQARSAVQLYTSSASGRFDR